MLISKLWIINNTYLWERGRVSVREIGNGEHNLAPQFQKLGA
jgi:hypothetical protein